MCHFPHKFTLIVFHFHCSESAIINAICQDAKAFCEPQKWGACTRKVNHCFLSQQQDIEASSWKEDSYIVYVFPYTLNRIDC